jgi:hypothetical protein
MNQVLLAELKKSDRRPQQPRMNNFKPSLSLIESLAEIITII